VAVNPQALEPRALSGDQRGSSFDLAIRIAIPSIKDDEVDDMSGFHLPGITVPAQKHQYINRSPPALSAKLIKKKAAQYSQEYLGANVRLRLRMLVNTTHPTPCFMTGGAPTKKHPVFLEDHIGVIVNLVINGMMAHPNDLPIGQPWEAFPDCEYHQSPPRLPGLTHRRLPPSVCRGRGFPRRGPAEGPHPHQDRWPAG